MEENQFELPKEIIQAYQEMWEEEDKRHKEWESHKQSLKSLIHPKYFDFIEEHESYYHKGIVEIEKTTDKVWGYSTTNNCRIKNGGSTLYLHQNSSVESLRVESVYEGEGVEYYVWQLTGYLGDDYSGYLLLPLNNGKWWQVGYSC